MAAVIECWHCGAKSPNQWVQVKRRKQYALVHASKIVLLEADRKIVTLTEANGQEWLGQVSIAQWMRQFPDRFVRVNLSAAVVLSAVDKWEKFRDGGRVYIAGKCIAVSKRKAYALWPQLCKFSSNTGVINASR